MAVGVIREIFTEYKLGSGGTYPFNDVRMRKAVIRKFVDKLVSTGLWSIVDELIPTADFETSAAIYRIWIKFKTSTHLLLFEVMGGVGYLEAYVQIYLLRTGGTTVEEKITGTLESITGNEATYPFARIGLTMLYGSSWCVFGIGAYTISTVASLPNINTSSRAWLGGFTFLDVTDETITTDVVAFQAEARSSAGYGALSGMYPNESSIENSFIDPTGALPTRNSTTNLMFPLWGQQGRNWKIKDWYIFSNRANAAVGSFLTIDGNYYWLTYANVIGKIGAVP